MPTTTLSPTYLAAANLPPSIWAALTQEASQRDIVTARRLLLIVLLWVDQHQIEAWAKLTIGARVNLASGHQPTA